MLQIRYEIFARELSVREVARLAHLTPETISRIIHGHLRPGFGPGQSAERIAAAVDWDGDLQELFAETEGGDNERVSA